MPEINGFPDDIDKSVFAVHVNTSGAPKLSA